MRPPPNPHLYTLDRPMRLAEVLAALHETPGRYRATLEGKSQDVLTTRPAPGEWSAFEVLCHVRDFFLVYANRFRQIAMEQEPLLSNFDENAWVESAQDSVADIPAMLDLIEHSRRDQMRMLERMSASCWEHTGRHEAVGVIVLEDYVRHSLAHEEMHLVQMAAALEGRVPD